MYNFENNNNLFFLIFYKQEKIFKLNKQKGGGNIINPNDLEEGKLGYLYDRRPVSRSTNMR